MFHLVHSSGRLRAAAESVISAAPQAVWALVADATRYPQWGPWSAAGYRGTAGHVPGAVYWLRSASRAYGRHVTTVERVEEIDQGRRIVVDNPCLMLKRFHVGNNIADLAGVEGELRHGRMTGDNTFGKRLFEVFDRIAQMQGAKRRCDFQRACAHFVDCVAARAIGQ